MNISSQSVWRERNDGAAAQTLVTSHLVAKIATRYHGYDVPLSEVISEGNYGIDAGGRTF
jgi:RNA polymerase sigma-32 factor